MISVVIPVYNYAHYLSEAADSVLQQDYPAIELILVDDGSTDNSWEVSQTYQDRAICLHKKNGGIGSARNLGVSKASGHFIAFLDADDVFTPGRLRRQMAVFREEPRMECVQGHMQRFISPEMPTDFAQRIRGDTEAVQAAPMASTTLIRRDAYERVGPWDESLQMGVDLEWYQRMKDTVSNYRMLPDVLLRRRIHDSNFNLVRADQQSERLHVLKRMMDRRRQSKTPNN